MGICVDKIERDKSFWKLNMEVNLTVFCYGSVLDFCYEMASLL